MLSAVKQCRVLTDTNTTRNAKSYDLAFLVGAADRGRTGTVLLPRDFKSLVSAYSTTAACVGKTHIRFTFFIIQRTNAYPEIPVHT